MTVLPATCLPALPLSLHSSAALVLLAWPCYAVEAKKAADKQAKKAAAVKEKKETDDW